MNLPETSPRVRPSENPFRSECVDRLEYRMDEVGWDKIAVRLERSRYRGALIGPHGHGKSTLLWAIGHRFSRSAKACGNSTHNVFLYVQVRPKEPEQNELVRRAIKEKSHLLLIDGYDLLNRRDRCRAVMRPGPTLVTSHRYTALPTLLRCQTAPSLLGELIGELSGDIKNALTAKDIADLHQRHRGNLRDAFRELYDRVADGEFVTKAFSA